MGRTDCGVVIGGEVCFTEVKEKSSHYGLNMLGYTCATRVNTIRCNSVI